MPRWTGHWSKGDVRLTMGGEPTFVAASDFEAPEWNIDALGPTKRAICGQADPQARPALGQGAALTYTMGKHYPGEQLPRWAIHAHWRADGEKVWKDPALLASDEDKDDAAATDAASFAGALAERLQLDPGLVNPAYEDIHYYLWREKRLPANVRGRGRQTARRAGARAPGPGVRAGLGDAGGQRAAAAPGDAGRLAALAERQMVFPRRCDVPGARGFADRPAPAAGEPALGGPGSFETDIETDPFAPRGQLPQARGLQPRAGQALPAGRSRVSARCRRTLPVVGREEPGLVRTALAVEARDGVLHVFYPPLYDVEDWLELTAAIEDTAAELGRKVVLEGYLPPEDPRSSISPSPLILA